MFLLLGMKCNKCVSWPVRKPRNSHGISAVILSTDHDHWTSAFGAEELRPISLEIASCRINRNININIDIIILVEWLIPLLLELERTKCFKMNCSICSWSQKVTGKKDEIILFAKGLRFFVSRLCKICSPLYMAS